MKTKSKLDGLVANCELTAKTLKALAHPHRLQLLCYMGQGEKTVGELVELCGASQSIVSQFLGRMKSEGLVTSIKEGQFVRYRIADQRVSRLMKALQAIFCGK